MFHLLPLVLNSNIYKYIYIYPTLFSGSYLVTEHSKGGIQNSHNKLQLKEKELTPSSQDITSSMVSTKNQKLEK